MMKNLKCSILLDKLLVQEWSVVVDDQVKRSYLEQKVDW